jgi:hypothetical protein
MTRECQETLTVGRFQLCFIRSGDSQSVSILNEHGDEIAYDEITYYEAAGLVDFFEGA